MSNDELLKDLTANVEQILARLQEPVERYRKTLDGLLTRDVSSDKTYRTNFTRFYRLRLPRTECYDHYFNLLERSKHQVDVRFADVLADLQTNTGRIEASFASKLVATVNPQRPVIDRIVLAALGERLPGYWIPNRSEQVIALYERLHTRFRQMQQDERFELLRSRFTADFSGYGFTDLKILDLLIWKSR